MFGQYALYQMLSVSRWLFLTLLIQISLNCAPCPSNSACIQNFCICSNTFVFNCTSTALSLPQSEQTITFPSSNTFYFVLQSITNEQIEYSITLTDPGFAQLLAGYDVSVGIDLGVGSPMGGDYKLLLRQSDTNSLTMRLILTLGLQNNQQSPQKLILLLTPLGTITNTLRLSYSYSSSQTTNPFIIVGYAAGGVLGAAVIILAVVLYRKWKAQKRQAFARQRQQEQQLDVSHFEQLMPACPGGSKDNREKSACSVCLQQIGVLSVVRRTVCGHIFHATCLDHWGEKQMNCPLCRTSLTKANILKLRVDLITRDDTHRWMHQPILPSAPAKHQQPED